MKRYRAWRLLRLERRVDMLSYLVSLGSEHYRPRFDRLRRELVRRRGY